MSRDMWRLYPTANGEWLVQKLEGLRWVNKDHARSEVEGKIKIANLKRSPIYVG